MRRVIIALAMLLGCGGGAAALSPSQPGAVETETPIPPELREYVERSSKIGRELYVQDKVAAIGTDVMLEHVRDLEHAGIAGYIQLREGDGHGGLTGAFLVSFYTPEQPPRVRYEVRVAPDAAATFNEYTPPKQGPEGFTLLVRARQLVIAAMSARQQPLNTVLVPWGAESEPGILVYLLAGTKRPNVAVLGRHYRAFVPLAGDRVSYIQPLSKSILEIPIVGPAGSTVENLGVSHLVTDYPLETHVFASLLYQLPIYVTTRRGLWKVDGERITLASRDPLIQ